MLTSVLGLWLICGIFFLLYVSVMIATFALVKIDQRFRAHTLVFQGFAILLGFSLWIFVSNNFEISHFTQHPFLHSAGIYLFLVMGFLMFYGLLDRSVSVKINIQIQENANKPISASEIVEKYRGEDSIKRRFEMMVENNYLQKQGNKYLLLPRGIRSSNIVLLIKKIFSIGLGG